MIVHIADRSVWAAAKERGSYEPPTLGSEGFVHLSRPDQVHLPANAIYSDTSNLVLLWVDPSRLTAPIRDEPPAPDVPMTFPHLYGPLNVDAVVAESPMSPWARGAFTLPAMPGNGN